jgi:hypothetical protein
VELQHLKRTFRKNGYSDHDINYALYTKNKQQKKTEEPTGIVMLPYQHATSNKISRVLGKYNMKTIHVPMKKTISTVRPLKDNLGLKNPGVYCIPRGCSEVYIGQHAEV